MGVVATTHDKVYQGKIALEQPVNGYRFGTDAMLLAAAVSARTNDKVLELGCGVGAVLLAAHSRLQDVFFTGIEREKIYADLAKENVLQNDADKISVINVDATDKTLYTELGMFDHIIANPPYYHAGQHSGAVDELRRVARQQEPDDLDLWLQAANRFLKPKGSVIFIHSIEKVDLLVAGLKKFCGDINIFPIWPQAGQACKRCLVRGIKGSKAPIALKYGLVMHEQDGSLTKRAAEIINTGKSLWEA